MLGKLLEERREEILQIAAQFGARNVRVFGSVARGEDGPESDVDLLVDFDPERSLLDQVGLVQDLEDLLRRKVQVSTPNALHWYVRDRILSQAVPL